MTQIAPNPENSGDGPLKGIGTSVLLALAFGVLSMLRLIGDSPSIVASQSALSSVLRGPLLKTQLALNVAWFALAHVLLILFFAALCWLLARVSRAGWSRRAITLNQWVLLWFVLLAFLVLVANATFYPWSLLGEPYAHFAKANWRGIRILDVLLLAVVCLVATAAYRIARRSAAKAAQTLRSKTAHQLILALVAIGLPLVLIASYDRAEAGSDKPNVIIIGIDALRHDALFRDDGANTPNLDDFVRNSVRFTDTITPLARTFPSWIATLTGRHPHTTGAIMNLLPRDLIDTGVTLPEQLRASGYLTAYATDEVRFANIDATFGFDRTITPPMGASDFLLGSLNDTPLSNLVSSTRVGRLLFPYSYGNRASAVTYYPDTFVDRIRNELPDQQPVFLAIHLTLAHWPYYWASAPERDFADKFSMQRLYDMSIREVDNQFAKVISTLKQKGLLENSIVVVMSDHGEAIGVPEDNPYSGDEYQLKGLVRLGHGTSVMSPTQYQVVLSVRSFGPAAPLFATSREVTAPVSLTDLAPTLLDALGIPHPGEFDGISLVDPLTYSNQELELRNRVRFTETEFNPRGFQPGVTLTASALGEIATFYELDASTDRILVRRERLPTLLSDRQYAAIGPSKVLAAVPAENASFRLILAERTGGQIMDASAADGEACKLYAALMKQFDNAFRSQRTTIQDWPTAHEWQETCRSRTSVSDNVRQKVTSNGGVTWQQPFNNANPFALNSPRSQ